MRGFSQTKWSIYALLAMAGTGCGNTSFNGAGGPAKKKTPNGEGAERVATFKAGDPGKPELADFLFVFDNSQSMKDDAKQAASGLASIPASSFPASSRLGVMTTMAAKDPLANLPITHDDVQKYPCINLEPGFLDLVNAKAIRDWRDCRVKQSASADAYKLSGCTSGWFEPFEKNSANQRCFDAALQNPFSAVSCEAGLLAVEQLLARKKTTPVFREGAAVTIVFVSDEQIGCKSPMTRGDPSDNGADAAITRIKDAIIANSKVSSIRFTGVIPEPGQVEATALSYQKVIERSGGKFFRITEARADYRSILEQIIDQKVVNPSREFSLEGNVSEILAVKVDSRKLSPSDYELLKDGEKARIRLKNIDADKEVEISVFYK